MQKLTISRREQHGVRFTVEGSVLREGGNLGSIFVSQHGQVRELELLVRTEKGKICVATMYNGIDNVQIC